jgi:ribosome biogenesis protein MAK21
LNDKDQKWFETVIRNGTLSDKIGALTLMVQQSPIHNLKNLETLVNMAAKAGKRESEMSMEPVKDLFLNTLLPDRKLRDFGKNPWLMSEKLSSGHLLVAEYESSLKSMYFKFVQGVEEATTKGLPHVKRMSMKTAFDLLSEKPEQEAYLLSILANKLGDPERKVAAKAAFLLSSLVEKHPAMKMVVVKEAENLIFRPNIAVKAQYYAIIFLNQILLTKEDTELARILLQIYFTMFERYTKKGTSEDAMATRLLSGLLTGVNRAYPYADTNMAGISDQIDSLFRIVHIGNFNTAVQALTLLFQVSEKDEGLRDRYFRALYSLMMTESLQTASKHTLLLNLMYRSFKADKEEGRCVALIKRLLQVCFHMEAPFICGSLYLVSQILLDRPSLQFIVLEQESTRAIASKVPEKAVPRATTADNDSDGDHEKSEGSSDGKVVYDANAREPRAAGAAASSLWELSLFATHSHPSVRKFAESIITIETSGGVSYKGDPLNDFTLISFLDRFAFRNPKKRDVEQAAKNKSVVRGHSKMQPYGFGKRGLNAVKPTVNSKEFMSQDIEDVPEDEKFYHEYFTKVQERDGIRRKKEKKVDDDDEGDAFDDEDEYADHLAEELMEQHAQSNGGADVDDDVDLDWSDGDDAEVEGVAHDDDEGASDIEDGFGGEDDEEGGDDGFDGQDPDGLDGDEDSDDGGFDDWEGLEEEDDDDDDDDDDGLTWGKGKGQSWAAKTGSAFASADDFAEILEAAGVDDRVPEKQRKWEEDMDHADRREVGKKRKFVTTHTGGKKELPKKGGQGARDRRQAKRRKYKLYDVKCV